MCVKHFLFLWTMCQRKFVAPVGVMLLGPSPRLHLGVSERVVAQPHLGEGPRQNGHLFRAGWKNETRRNDLRLKMWRIEDYDKEIRRTRAKRRSEGAAGGTPSFSDTTSAPRAPPESAHAPCLPCACVFTPAGRAGLAMSPSWRPRVRRGDNGDVL